MTPEQMVISSIGICLVGALLTLLVSRNRIAAGWLAFLVAAIASAMVLSAVFHVLSVGPSAHSASFLAMPSMGFALRIYVDGLTSIFLMLAAVISLPACLYSIVYMRHYSDYSVARYYPWLLIFQAALYGLTSTTDMMWFFFIFWQMMTIPGFALIRFENRKTENVRAATKFLVMMELACAATMVGAQILAVSGAHASGASSLRYDFDTVSSNLPLLLRDNPAAAAFAFGLFLMGFGVKMGMWPFGQIWLPDAHPAAPSPISAMLSGVMIKTGVYGLIRYFLWLVPLSARADYPLGAWGIVVAVLGTITLFTGTMQALKQEQSKRLLAFHSIGQVGYILLGAGVCMALVSTQRSDMEGVAAIALFGALFHVLNHGIFKALLFLNAGSMLHATGTQDLNEIGGLMRFMPITAANALIASSSISGVPLCNGFASKWTIVTAAVSGSAACHYLAICAIFAIITSALTLASFIKFFGVSFLSRTSAVVAERAATGRLEVCALMQAPQVALAALCVSLGVFPVIAFGLLGRALDASRHSFGIVLAGAAPVSGASLLRVRLGSGDAVFAPLALLVLVCATLVLTTALAALGGARRRAAAPWLCGYALETECVRYSAHGFYGEIKRYFGWLGGAAHSRPAPTQKKKEL